MNTLTSIAQNIDVLSKEKKIDPQVIISAIEDAVVTASRKQFKTGEDLHARYNLDTGTIELYAVKTVVELVEDSTREMSVDEATTEVGEGAEVGDMLELPRPMEGLGRIAAQTAKQIILQKVREAERNNVFEEYFGRRGELVNGFIKRFEGGKVIVDIGNGIEAVMPKPQQSRVENFTQGERVRVVINDVGREAKGPQIEVSRTSPELVKRLFEMEVPEIYDGTVVIKAAVREPGDRAKIAVVSNERDVDPVGACVGMKGSRVQSIIRELRGEKIDIIEWSEDPAIFAANALSPAKVSKVTVLDFEDRKLQVTVENEQQSLAIGKRGQNVRLAARLVDWDIDIRSEEEMKREIATQMEQMISAAVVPLSSIEGISASDSAALAEHGIDTIEELAEVSVDDICDWLDVSYDEAQDLIDMAIAITEARKSSRGADDQDPVGDDSESTEDASNDVQSEMDSIVETESTNQDVSASDDIAVEHDHYEEENDDDDVTAETDTVSVEGSMDDSLAVNEQSDDSSEEDVDEPNVVNDDEKKKSDE